MGQRAGGIGTGRLTRWGSSRRRSLLVGLTLGPGATEAPVELLERAARQLPRKLLRESGLGPLIFHQWAWLRPSLSPAAAAWLDEVRDQLHADGAAMLSRERGWEKVIAAMEEAGVSCCLLKGAALRIRGRTLPGRAQGDLDLLVPDGELEQAEALLQDRGYRLLTEYQSREGYLTDHFHLPMIGPEGQVELHWSLGRRVPDGSMARLWERTRLVPTHGMELRVLSPADHLLHSCLHISEHAFSGMARWLGELAREIDVLEPEDATDFQEEASHWPLRPVSAPLSLLDVWRNGAAGAPSVPEPSPVNSPFLFQSMTALAFGDGFPGIPHPVLVKAMEEWLRSHRSFPWALSKVVLGSAGGKLSRGWSRARGEGSAPPPGDGPAS